MTDPRLAWFAIGATCSAVLFGWPWHPRFSRYSQRMGPPQRPQPPPGRVVDIYGRTVGYIPRSRGSTPNPPPSHP